MDENGLVELAEVRTVVLFMDFDQTCAHVESHLAGSRAPGLYSNGSGASNH